MSEVPNLAVPRCSNCGEVVFDYAADEQIREAFRTQFGPAETATSDGQNHRSERSVPSKTKIARKEVSMPTIIKPDVYQLVTAFGQACAYCLFSHKVYLVISNKAPKDEIARLDALCQVFGLGFVLFDSDNPKDPRFAIRARPRYQQPDLFYANQYMRKIETELFSQ